MKPFKKGKYDIIKKKASNLADADGWEWVSLQFFKYQDPTEVKFELTIGTIYFNCFCELN